MCSIHKKVSKMVADSFFFFKQKTAYEMVSCDWSSDVCSSDLEGLDAHQRSNQAGTAITANMTGKEALWTCIARLVANRGTYITCGMTPFSRPTLIPRRP